MIIIGSAQYVILKTVPNHQNHITSLSGTQIGDDWQGLEKPSWKFLRRWTGSTHLHREGNGGLEMANKLPKDIHWWKDKWGCKSRFPDLNLI